MKIYMIGFMASGKTSVGKRLAKKLQLSFMDMDPYLENKYGKPIPEIFKEDGEDKFREYERNVLADTFSMDDIVIATGGGTPCFFDNMEVINENGISVYLNHSIDFYVYKLLHAKTVRPLVVGKTEDELRDYIVETLGHREQFYKKAKHIVNLNGEKKDEIADIICKIINKDK